MPGVKIGSKSESFMAMERDERDSWRALSGAARDVLLALHKFGPVHDSNIPSKKGRDELIEKELCVKICLADGRQGYQALTYKGLRVYKQGIALRALS